MKDIFIADAHLYDPADANYQALLNFLSENREDIGTLYLLGDVFEFWIGFRYTVFAPYVPLLEALRQLRAAGGKIVFVEGNHDFHLGPYIEEVLGCRVLPDGGIVEIGGKKVYIGHGDLINPQDRGYRILRRFLRSAPVRVVARILPPDWSWAIARCASALSQKTHEAKSVRWAPEDLLENHARQRFAEGCEAVVTGHFHAPLLRRIENKTMISLGDWIDQYSYAVYENGEFSLKTFKTGDQ